MCLCAYACVGKPRDWRPELKALFWWWGLSEEFLRTEFIVREEESRHSEFDIPSWVLIKGNQ